MEELYQRYDRRIITKLLIALTQTMEASADFVYTTEVTEAHITGLENLRYTPQIFQPTIDKVAELRVIVVGERFFVGKIDTRDCDAGRIDWRLADSDVTWTEGHIDADTQDKLQAFMSALGLHYGAIDLIVPPAGPPVFLEVNPAGEWGWLERDLGFPIATAIADALITNGEPS